MRWCLNDLYISFDSPEFLADFESAKKQIASLSEWADKNLTNLDNPDQKLVEYIQIVNQNSKTLGRLMTFAMLTRSVDDDNQDAKKYGDMLRVAYADLAKPTAMFNGFVGK